MGVFGGSEAFGGPGVFEGSGVLDGFESVRGTGVRLPRRLFLRIAALATNATSATASPTPRAEPCSRITGMSAPY